MEGPERMASLKRASRGEVGRGLQEKKARACAEMPVSAAPAEPAAQSKTQRLSGPQPAVEETGEGEPAGV